MGDFSIFINFKTYPQATGGNAVKLAKICEELGEEKKMPIIPVVQAIDLALIKKEVKIPVWLQHLDFQSSGAFTGWQNIEAAVEAGAEGTLLNHSEHPIPPGTIKQIITRIRKLKKGNFKIMVCCKTLGQAERLIRQKPDYLGYEVSELIGGKVSVTDANPQAISRGIKLCGKIPLIVGAGIHKAEDLKKARDLGAKGVLVSSAVVLAEDQVKELLELTKLF